MPAASRSHGPLVSVITPTWNMGDRLARCIASIRSQTHPNIEHIIVDGGSSDGTVDLLRSTDGIKWVSESDSGQSDAINKGFRMAEGDILGWLNADDELTPAALERVVRAAQRNPRAGLFYGDIEVFDASSSRRVPPDSTDFTFTAMWRGNTISQPGTFWTRAAHETVGPIDEDFRLTMDYELWLRFAKAGIIAEYIPHVQARFEIHDASKTGTAGMLAFVEEEAAALRKHGEPHGAAMAIDRWYWNDVVRRVGEAAASGRRALAAEIASEALPRLRPLRSMTRWFLLLARTSPRAAAWVYRRRISQTD